MINFFESNEDCPTCQQHIDEVFKETMITSKKTNIDELDSGLSKLKKELSSVNTLVNDIKTTTDYIRNNTVKLAKINTSIKELEKFNVKLQTEIDQFTKDGAGQSDLGKLKDLKESIVEIAKRRSKLKEDKVYYETARTMLTDTA